MTPAPTGPSITIAVLTYKRLDQLLPLVAELRDQARAFEGVASILVVDNDPDASARHKTIRALGDSGRYVHEATPGIAAARNRALREADSALLVFIDDDEVPVEGWLRLLTDEYLRSWPVAVVGPVVSTYEETPEPWIEAGGFFTRRRLRSGTRVDVAATNNLLLDLAWLRARGIEFDDEFGLSGGSDTLFSRQIAAAGGEMVWCDEAVVYDVVPRSRSNREWVLQRAYRSGNSWSRSSLALQPTVLGRTRTRCVLVARGSIRLAGGSLRGLIGSITHNMVAQARGTRTRLRGAGMLSGAIGHVYSEYSRPASVSPMTEKV
ncbi:glycosyltransferase family 2 protein [Agreia sp. COWG]|uniref:glycosyltransferase family 2 protein n=1 Tax=Agreia sp. COWG TaxID=2773266 RepID=UPI0019252485|nr:glycosyltransferase [Agreia sp. COWG]CAD5991121.1 Glyco_trans_2-like domain-containing protein [Agreia sp. COWG]